MPIHEVKQGEYVSMIARAYGFENWRAVWDSDENAPLRELRRDPNVLAPGDQLFVPEPDSSGLAVATGRRHVIQRAYVPDMLRLRLGRTWASGGLAGVEYRLVFEARTYEGKVPDGGAIEHEIPRGEREATLELYIRGREQDPWAMKLEIGTLDPVDTATGRQARLRNLGLQPLADDREAASKVALRCLQRQEGQLEDGECNAELEQRLARTYGV